MNVLSPFLLLMTEQYLVIVYTLHNVLTIVYDNRSYEQIQEQQTLWLSNKVQKNPEDWKSYVSSNVYMHY